MRQLIFLKDYTEELYNKVRERDFTAYHADKFDYDKEATFATNIERRDDCYSIRCHKTTSTLRFLFLKRSLLLHANKHHMPLFGHI